MSHRAFLRILLAAFFAGGAALHFRATDALVSITPAWVPYPREVVYATGIIELIGVAMLVFPQTRKAGGILLALYMLAVWPANFKHALEGIAAADPGYVVVSRTALGTSANHCVDVSLCGESIGLAVEAVS